MKLAYSLPGFALALAIAIGSSVGAHAAIVTLTPPTSWTTFMFGNVGSSFGSEFQFDLTTTAELKVTDGYLDGDQFDITINKVDQGPTSTPTNDGTFINTNNIANWDVAFASDKFSHAFYILGPGEYDVTGTVLLSPNGSGAAALEVVAATPLPSTWLMLLGGFAGLGFFSYRGTKKISSGTLAA
jgi:hypothetical protein